MNNHRLQRAAALCLLAYVILGCGSTDTGVSSTSDADYVLALQVFDPVVQVGDQTPLILRLRHGNSDALPRGLAGIITVTTSVHGKMDAVDITFSVTDDTTDAFLANLTFTAVQPGVAEVRATYQDASAQVKILVSEAEG